MSPFTSTSKVVGSLISRRNGIRHLVKHAGNGKSHRIRCFSGITGIETPLLIGSKRQDVCSSSSILSNVDNLQRRTFLGVGDGEEGGVLSKVYEERRVLGYSPEQLFNVVAAVDLYHDFLPWCQRSETTASDTTLFDHLINTWEFNPGPVPGTCNLYFLVDFKFQSPLYSQVASMFFREVVSRLVGSFSERCRLVYGPGVQVLENSYGQST
ncbi:hypothetical protein L484_000662 [Morus notabilis]|uniref:Coenzyme Q-binding protein COQ10 START domain-containing protein n=1 Tax=Morus notabilis TaxID=981085 RepID=W9T1X9_9ROSA|nr:hypothetical protein L484_000662 [Morus notabilis]